MDQEALWREYSALPPEDRRKVEEFIELLLKRNATMQDPRSDIDS